jgi:RNA polymerase sigma-70 factor, ECF subfamily
MPRRERAVTERELLDSARNGDEHAFGRLVDSHRNGLFAHCYRMLGSPQDAEDALQETLLRAWRGLEGFEGRSSPRSWLYTIATNASLRALERRPPRVLPLDHGPATDPQQGPGGPLAESVWVEPLPDEPLGLSDGPASPEARYEQRESVELAFVAALQTLSARQRAVLILRDVLGFSAREVGETLDVSPTAVDSALARARRTLEEHLPQRSQQAALRVLGDERLNAIVARYMDAWGRGDAQALAAILAEEATISMPPHATWYEGRDAVERFLASWPMANGRRWPSVRISANGQLAFAHYAVDRDDGSVRPHSISLIDLDDERIVAITSFLMPHLFPMFGLGEEPGLLAGA